jgi:LPS O-antigen subunit length determinant protein (WzzB/FepE family)
MQNSNSINEEEINLIDVILTIWNGKFKILIITLIFLSLGFVYINFKDDSKESYRVSFQIKPTDSIFFLKYISLNDIILSNKILQNSEDKNSYLLNNKLIFKRFINDFMDYEELKLVLKSNPYVKKQIAELSKKNKETALNNFAESFTISTKKKNQQKEYFLNFNWHNVDEGLEIANETINLVLSNVKNLIIRDIEILIKTIQIKNSNKLQLLELELQLISQSNNEQLRDKDLLRLLYLNEQLQIAKELDIENSQVDEKRNNEVFFTIKDKRDQCEGIGYKSDTQGFADCVLSLVKLDNKKQSTLIKSRYYLIGSKAIEKEIKLIKDRNYQAQEFSNQSEKYYSTKKEINKIESNISSKKLLESISILKNDKQSFTIDYDLLYSDVTSLQKQINKKLILIIAIFFGLMIGLIYVFISKAFQNRINYLEGKR